MTDLMKAIRIHEYGGPEEMRYEDVPRPVPGEREVLIWVHAASINPVDWKVRDGLLRERLLVDFPFILGGDFSGVVAAIGPGVENFQEGMAVYGMTSTTGYRYGALAEYVAVRAQDIVAMPKNLDYVQAASVPLAALTAWQALFDRGELRRGQKVLIQGGAGGVGSFAIQFAKNAGAHVITTASAGNAGYLRELGADLVIDYHATRFEDVVSDVDIVIDLIGGETQSRSYDVVRSGGTLVNAWGAILQEKADAAGVRGVKVAVTMNGQQLSEITRLIEAGKVRTTISDVFPLAEAGPAYELSKAGHVRGKIVLAIA